MTLRDDVGPPIGVTCTPNTDGWQCLVRVGDDDAATEHTVTVDHEALAALAPAASPEELVLASFRFLLEREPREAIMRSFELPIISRFFADYGADISRRLG
jgi:hypothetical protein